MLRAFILSALFCASPAVAQHAQTDISAPPETLLSSVERLLAVSGHDVISQSCCKHCRKGKACGNSCISRSYQCHKGRGCACD